MQRKYKERKQFMQEMKIKFLLNNYFHLSKNSQMHTWHSFCNQPRYFFYQKWEINLIKLQTFQYWWQNKYIVARNCLHSSKQANSSSLTSELIVLFTTIKTLHQCYSLFAFSTAMLFTTRKKKANECFFRDKKKWCVYILLLYRGQNLQGAN